jgi:hypothetical protein
LRHSSPEAGVAAQQPGRPACGHSSREAGVRHISPEASVRHSSPEGWQEISPRLSEAKPGVHVDSHDRTLKGCEDIHNLPAVV